MNPDSKVKKFAFYNVVILLITVQLVILINYWYFVFKNIGQATINDTIAYQGKLIDSTGSAVPDGSYNMEFSIYNVETGGTPLWTERWSANATSLQPPVIYTPQNGNPGSQVSVVNGIFSVELNSLCSDWNAGTCATGLGVDFNSPSLYLEVKFDSTVPADAIMDQIFSPRKRFSSVAYAMNSAKLDGKVVGISGDTIPVLNANNTWSGENTITVSSANNNGLIIKSLETSIVPLTDYLTKWTDSNNTLVAAVHPFGTIQSIPPSANYPAFMAGALPNTSPTDLIVGLYGTGPLAINSVAGIIQLGSPTLNSVAHVGINTTLTNPTDTLSVTVNSAAEKGIVIKGAASQTGNLLELQDSTGLSLLSVSSAGVLTSGVPINTAPFVITSTALVTNLNADLLDGIDSTAFVLKAGDTMTGNLYLSKANPELRLIDTGNSEYSRITRSATNNQLNLYNRVSAIAVTSYQLNLAANQQITTNYNVDLDTDTFSVSAWIKVNDISSNSYTIFGSTNAGYAGGYWILLHRADKGGVVLQSQGSGQVINFTTPSTNLTAGQWAHIVMVKSGSNVKIYQDNTLISDETINNLLNFTATPLQIGGLLNANYFNGAMDETTFWSKSLTGPEITTLYNSGLGLYGSAETGLAIGYHFNEGSGTSITDYSGLSNTGTLSGSVTWGAGEKAQPTSSSTEVSVIQNENGSIAGTSTTTLGDATGTININGTTVKVGTGNINWLTITNGATGVAPVFAADGETNVSLYIKPKGIGSIIVQSPDLIGNIAAIPLIVKGITGQTGNLQQWQDSTGLVKLSVGADGSITMPGLLSCNTLDTDSTGKIICGTDETGGGGSPAFTGGAITDLLTLATQTQTNLVSATSTLAVANDANAYVLTADMETTAADIITTYNITGVPGAAGNRFSLDLRVMKGITGASQTHTIALEINGSAIGGIGYSVTGTSAAELSHGYDFKWNPFTSTWVATLIY